METPPLVPDVVKKLMAMALIGGLMLLCYYWMDNRHVARIRGAADESQIRQRRADDKAWQDLIAPPKAKGSSSPAIE